MPLETGLMFGHLGDKPKILVIARQGIGDALFFCPTLALLRSKFPQARLDLFLAPTEAQEIFRHAAFWDNLYLIERGKPARKLQQLHRLSQVGYDVAILPFPSGYRSALIACLLRIPIRIGCTWRGFYRPMKIFLTHPMGTPGTKHNVLTNLDLLRPLGIQPSGSGDIRLIYSTTEEERALAMRFLTDRKIVGTLLGVHPGCGARIKEKRWPLEKFVELLTRLGQKWHAHVLVFGGGDETQLVSQLVAGLGERVTPVQSFPLALVAALIERCSLFAGNDTSALHLANALGVPVVGVYGPTDPARVGPFNPLGAVVRSGIECSPCYMFSPFFHCIHETNLCLQNLEVDPVYERCEALLALSLGTSARIGPTTPVVVRMDWQPS